MIKKINITAVWRTDHRGQEVQVGATAGSGDIS